MNYGTSIEGSREIGEVECSCWSLIVLQMKLKELNHVAVYGKAILFVETKEYFHQ